jgi:hypothetical protein
MRTDFPFFRVATEGKTTDGRSIHRDWIEQMARQYDPQLYSARVFLEHIRGMAPESPFKAYGDVVALKTQELPEGKLALLAQIDPTPELVALVKAKQKIYASIEVDPDFADTKAAYLVGLGITDSPASLRTERLSFTARQPVAQPVFSEVIEMSDEQGAQDSPSVFDKVKALLRSKPEPEIETRFADLERTIETLAETIAQHRTAFAALERQLAQTPDEIPCRPLATGAASPRLTDC